MLIPTHRCYWLIKSSSCKKSAIAQLHSAMCLYVRAVRSIKSMMPGTNTAAMSKPSPQNQRPIIIGCLINILLYAYMNIQYKQVAKHGNGKGRQMTDEIITYAAEYTIAVNIIFNIVMPTVCIIIQTSLYLSRPSMA